VSSKFAVLSVDDEPATQDLIGYALDNEFDLLYANSGEQALQMLQQQKPDLILLDVRMQGIDGYQLCRTIKDTADTASLPIIFVSAMDSLEERLQGYQAGGDDYLIKPFQAEELRTKTKLAIETKRRADQLQQNANDAMRTAMTAMTSTGELGVVLNFLSESFRCNNYQALAQAILDSMANYQLNCCLQIRSEKQIVELAATGSVSAIESSLLTKLASEKRIFDFGNRTAFNFPGITLLIKNMPQDDSERYGRIKDNVALLVEGADARIHAIAASNAVSLQQQALSLALDGVENAIQGINQKYHQQQQHSASILEDLRAQVEESFFHLGLSEQQEQKLMEIVNSTLTRSQALFDQGLEVDQLLGQLAKRIEQFH